jgi:hypothetical protein
MKHIVTSALIFIFCINCKAQTEIRGSMGIDFFSAPSLVNYINQNYVSYANRLNSINSAVVFELEGNQGLSKNFMMGIEISYLINSFTYSVDIGQYNLSYNIFEPDLLGYYVIPGQGYEFKFGFGFGFPFVSADEYLPGTGSTTTYKSNGFSVILKGDGNTIISGNLYANINVGLKYGFNGKPSYDNNYIQNPSSNYEKVNFNSLSFFMGLGVTYRF